MKTLVLAFFGFAMTASAAVVQNDLGEIFVVDASTGYTHRIDLDARGIDFKVIGENLLDTGSDVIYVVDPKTGKTNQLDISRQGKDLKVINP